MTKFRAAVSACLAAALAYAAHAQEYPSRSVHIVVPFAPGGPNDLIVRLVTQGLAERLGQPVLVDNRPGAGGNIGTDFVAKSIPDGYTLLSAGPGSLIINPLMAKAPYDTQRDFAPVTIMARAPNVLAVHPSVPARSISELIALARAHPGAINYASGGNGSTPHLSAALFAAMAGIELTHVPYKGTAPATADLVGGQVQIAFLGIPAVLPHLKSGRLRALAVTGLRRSPELPDIPTVDESGVPGYEVSPWYGLLAPAVTPRAIVARLAGETARIVRAVDTREKLALQGAEAAGTTPEEYAEVIRADTATWTRVIANAGLGATREH
jgi:tripartite-type tricarboxylate transporter receptor subunit TctC